MDSIAFIDLEVHTSNKKILDIGALKADGSQFHHVSITAFYQFLNGTRYICGHNIFNHDIKYLGNGLLNAGIEMGHVIDTLYLSALLFPKTLFHALLKDDKLQTEEKNNPLNDSIKARDLLHAEIAAFHNLDASIKNIMYALLHDQKEFAAFFKYIHFNAPQIDIETSIRETFEKLICQNANLSHFINQYPIELAYSLSLIHVNDSDSVTAPWVIKNYPNVENIMYLLRNKPCITGCKYCNEFLNIYTGLKKYFGYDAYRTFAGEDLQERAVKAAIDNKSLLAVFPTGGGKSLTFQVPALMNAENSKSLTVIISPLQSLMKDQVDNLEEKGITKAVTINGLLDPIERSKSFERVENGSAGLLYISPESLRSKSIERLILNRNIARFVIDEAHCFSAWGQDFRVDYMYIGDFIKNIKEKKNLQTDIPVSCFTATAKQKVIEDIKSYFKEKLDLDLELFTSSVSRTNLKYKVIKRESDEEKYLAVRDLVLENPCPTIIYVARTKRAFELAEKLSKDGLVAKPYHGKMDKKEKSENQDAFKRGEVQLMVATSAFGMGVDKNDVGMVIHYDISDSLENYVQEAGRAGRDENINADCYVLFNEEDLSKHFILLNQTKLSIKEIQQIWKAIKNATKFRNTISNSALEIAKKAGWDETVMDIETRVTTAISTLEEAGYIKRGQNMPRVFANSIVVRTANEAIQKIKNSQKFDEKQKLHAERIIKALFSSKSKINSPEDDAESRVDYISDRLQMRIFEVIQIINLLREENILADAQDLTAFIKKGENQNRSLGVLEGFVKLETHIVQFVDEDKKILNLKELNESLELQGCEKVNISKIKTLLNFWTIKNIVQKEHSSNSKNHIRIKSNHPIDILKQKIEKRHILSRFIVEYLFEKMNLSTIDPEELKSKAEVLIEFSVHELKKAYEQKLILHKMAIDIADVEDALFFLSRIEAIKIEGGFLVIYNRLSLERKETDNKKQYTKEDYQKLHQFYESKVQQIHIVGEYANRMIGDYKEALQFVDDYFRLNYSSFLNKYFKGERQGDIKRTITPEKFKQIFGDLSPTQLAIIKDNNSQHIAVTAGPGSGKTRVLVHKLASLLLMEDVKHEQLLMLTFSRAAALEFKKRLQKITGNAAHFVEIKTFHSYCFDLLGRVGTLDKTDDILSKTVEHIKSGEVEISRITKTVLMIDEAQDMSLAEYNLIKTLMEQNEEMRVIAVGDDDQNIYEFRGSDSKFFEDFINQNKATKHELLENYRSKNNLVEFSNQCVQRISHRLKQTAIVPHQQDNGRIQLVHYHNGNIITGFVQSILSASLTGSTCILTHKNDEASEINGLLRKSGLPSKLIQSNDEFNLYNLSEIRYFIKMLRVAEGAAVIADENWEYAMRHLLQEYRSSNKLELCKTLLTEFEKTNKKIKFISDLESFIQESQPEDFASVNGESIYVSTMHKAKGKEFNTVFLLLNNFDASSDRHKRLLYVSITRAKSNLFIHYNSNFFNNIQLEHLEKIEDKNHYLPSSELIQHLSYRDVYLDYFVNVQHHVQHLKSGDILTITSEGCGTEHGLVLKFSRLFSQTIKKNESQGYKLKSANVNYSLYWKNSEGKEYLIILPEICFEKMKESPQN